MKSVLVTRLMLLLAALLCGNAMADDPPAETANAPIANVVNCAGDQSPWRDFDFWVGQWEVFDPESGRKYGDNHIQKMEQGCLILELWNSMDGTTGISMNFYDPLLGKWRQVWQNAAFFIDYSGGLDDQSRMQLEGQIFYHANGFSAPFRGLWTEQKDGSVLQEFWQYDAESEQWNPWFAGIYRKAEG